MAKIPGAINHVGKGSTEELLPHRSALMTLAGGRKGFNNYAKATPSGVGAPSILGMSPPDNDGVNG